MRLYLRWFTINQFQRYKKFGIICLCSVFIMVTNACTDIPAKVTPQPPPEPKASTPVIIDLGFTPRPAIPTPTSTLVMAEPWTPTPVPTLTALPDQNRAWVLQILTPETIQVILEGDPLNQTYTIRLLGLEAPDGVWRQVGIEQLDKIIGGQVIRLVKDETTINDLGELPRYAYKGGLFLNQYLLEEGFVRLHLESPDTRFASALETAAQQAQNAGAGLWGPEPTPTATINTQ